jgi:predicted GTPase
VNILASAPQGWQPPPERRVRVLVLGAAGRDFHNFNLVYRDDPSIEVVAFTAAQIPGLPQRRYPGALAGALYPEGIPIVPEEALETLVRMHRVARVVFAYSDVSHEEVMHHASHGTRTVLMPYSPRSRVRAASRPRRISGRRSRACCCSSA